MVTCKKTASLSASEMADLKASQLSIPPELTAAIDDVRSDASNTNWCLAALGPSNELHVVGTGTGGAVDLAAKLTPESAYYGLVRTTEAIDSGIVGQKDAVKFAFITYLGDELGVMRKGKIATFKGTITHSFEPFHAELMNATSPDEVTDGAITELRMCPRLKSTLLQRLQATDLCCLLAHSVGSMFGNATARAKAADGSMRIGQRTVKIDQAGSVRTGLQSAAVTSKQDVNIPPDLLEAVADVRSDASTTDWCLCRLENNSTTLVMVGSGSKGTSELAAHLTSDHAYYGLVRTTESIDTGARKVDAVKFAFITFLGEGLSVLKKGKITTLKGTITEVFAPFHVELMNATSPSEVTSDAITELLHSLFGDETTQRDAGSIRVGQQTIRVQHKDCSAGSAAAIATPRMPGAMGGVGGGGTTLRAQAEALPAPVSAALAEVREDKTASDWCVVGYDDGKEPALKVVAKGEGRVEAVQPYLLHDQLLYALVRVEQKVDASTTVKFVLVSWIGNDVAPMRKAKLSTKRGAATTAIGPFHAEMLNPTEASAVTHQAIMRLLET